MKFVKWFHMAMQHQFFFGAGINCRRVCGVSNVYILRAGIASKRLRGSSCFFACGLPSTYATLCFKESIGYLEKEGYLLLELCPKLWT